MDLFGRWRRRAPDAGVAGALARPPGGDTGGPTPTPVTRDRVRRWFERSGYTYFTDSDGDLGGLWRGRLFFFLLLGEQSEILQVRGHWQRELAIERLAEVLELCNAWHVERIWPQCYARVRDDGMVHVTCEVTTDLEYGVTDAQLDVLLGCGIGTCTAFFDELETAYPDPAAAPP